MNEPTTPNGEVQNLPPSSTDDATVAGRGFLLITGAKIWFMVGGTLITFGLPFIFAKMSGDPAKGKALFGQYFDLNNILSIFSMVMVTGVMQSVSKFVAARPTKCSGIVTQARNMMLVVGGLVGMTFFVAGDWIAETRDNPALGNGYRAAGIILFCYGIYTVYIGTLNGQKRFLNQAMFDIGFTTLKACLVLGMAAAGLGVLGAFYGFATAAVIIMLVAIVYVSRTVEPGEKEPELYGFAAKVMLYTLIFNLIFKLDAVCIKPIAMSLFGNGDAVMAEYGMAVNVSRLPWQATIAITFVIFPMVSQATFAEDLDRTRLYIRQTLRYSTILVGAAVVVLLAMPDVIFRLLPKGYESGAVALVWLAPAYFSFSLFNIVNTLLMSANQAGKALFVGCITVMITLLYFYILQGLGSEVITDKESLLRYAAIGPFITFTVGLLLGLAVLWQRYGSPIPIGTVIRVFLVGAITVFCGRSFPEMGRILSLAVAGLTGLLFLIGLLVSGEFGPEDKRRFMKVIRRKKS